MLSDSFSGRIQSAFPSISSNEVNQIYKVMNPCETVSLSRFIQVTRSQLIHTHLTIIHTYTPHVNTTPPPKTSGMLQESLPSEDASSYVREPHFTVRR